MRALRRPGPEPDEHGLDGLLEPLSRCLDAESARRVVDLQVPAPVQERIDMLAERINEGTLTDPERAEYETLINAADFISILKLKARLHLEWRTPKMRIVVTRSRWRMSPFASSSHSMR